MYVIKTHDFLLLSLFAVGRPQKYSKYWGISGQTHSVYGTPRLTRGFRLYKKSRAHTGRAYAPRTRHRKVTGQLCTNDDTESPRLSFTQNLLYYRSQA